MKLEDLKLNGYELYSLRDMWQIDGVDQCEFVKRIDNYKIPVSPYGITEEQLQQYIEHIESLNAME